MYYMPWSRIACCVMFESRAWCSALSGGFTGESGAVQKAVRGLVLAVQAEADQQQGGGQEFKKVMEQWGLMRLAFSAARCALSPPASLQVAASCFAGVSSPDSLGARHALALAALASLEPQAVMVVVAELGPRLAHNLALARITDGEGALNLR
ncbi:uncharacterized protein HaLaN_02561 [Haematococcus lacustris]|uniref:Uncharacterized protein n=1 Tax=Haematococcus lacustris TaxID=44745 RepID=A0A699YC05_HAELA|nr:uncharacterized protein HaLaN_02561 [Haematococcus lacustris]